MRDSRRLKRMARNRSKVPKLNLTSLMDVFTILVFFLLVNSGSVEVMEAPKDVKLPESRIEQKPRETVVVSVGQDDVLVQGKLVAHVGEILAGGPDALRAIADRLADLRDNVVGPATMAVAGSREVTILADKAVPFIVVRRVMSACTIEGYEIVSLAVIQQSPQATAI